jgi:hypothetical protein
VTSREATGFDGDEALLEGLQATDDLVLGSTESVQT